MQNFSIGIQVKNELAEFSSKKVQLATTKEDNGVRVLSKQTSGYYFNQREALALIDLYYNSQFESGPFDEGGKRKMFMNIGKFRTDVAAKQVDIDVKDFRFIPDDYADPWTSFFMQKDFKEWAKESDLSELVNQCVETFPKYGSVVLKKVGKTIQFVPLQNLKNEQTAKNLKTASYVIEEHPDMHLWEIKEMKGWNSEGLTLRFDETLNVYERYGHVPLAWLKQQNKEPVEAADWNTYVDAMVIMAYVKNDVKSAKNGEYIFFAEEITERPYREAHWSRQHGRWLGMGVMEDLVENQKAKNIVVNLVRKSLQWAAKKIGQSANADASAKNLVADVPDGAILEVGQNGQITMLDLSSKSNAEFQQFLNEWEHNSDQKAFTYEVATGESLPSGTPFRLGVVMSNAVNSFFGLKREKLGLFLKSAIRDFMIPQFIKDMGNEERVVSLFSDEPGYEALKDAAMDWVRSEACRATMLSGEVVDKDTLVSAIQPFEAVRQLFFELPAAAYKDAKYKFDFTVTGEEIDLQNKLETLKTLYQVLDAKGDPRAEKVLERIAALSGENLAVYGPKGAPAPATPARPSPYAQTPTPQEEVVA